jgi:hypothetical protein
VTKINAYTAAFDAKSAPARLTDAANQRDSWLRQMELAQLAEMGKAGESHDGSAANFKAPAPALRPMPHARRTQQEQAGADGQGQATAPPGQAAPRDEAASQAAQTRADEAGADTGASAEAGTGGSTAGAAQNGQLRTPRSDGGSALAVVATPTPVPATPAGAAAAATAPLAATTVQVMQRSAARAPAGVGETAAPPAEPGPEAENPEQPAAHAGREEPAADKPNWQKRMMHLSGKGKDVDVWIRDAQLGAQQTASLVYRLAGDMASMGLRLKGATVNGKPVRGETASPAACFAEELETPPTIVSPPGDQHGTR